MARIKGRGHSTGCRTCRRRRVKCDERHPACERCEKGRRECEGYARDHRFVDENARTERHAKRTAASKKSNSPSPSPPPESPTSKEIIEPPNLATPVERSLGLSGFEQNIHISFLLENFLTGLPNPSPWLKIHAQDPSPSSQMSIRALGAVYFGKAHRLNGTTAHSLELYSKALVNLNHDLRDSEHASSISVLKSAMTLELYEFIAFSSASGWMKHAGGVGRLIELRGPRRHQVLAERELLESNRVTIALECLIKRKRCFLEHSDWKIIPWAVDPDSKTLVLYLHDILCDVPGLSEDATSLRLSNLAEDQRRSLQQDLSRNIMTHLRTLYEWRATWQQQHPDSCFEVPTSISKHQLPFPTVIYYSTLFAASEICFYNALLLLILGLGSQVIGTTFDPSLPSLDLPGNICYGALFAPGTAPNAQAVATEICRSVEYHLLHPASSAAAFFLLFPLRLAYQAFDADSQQSQWLSSVMKNIADESWFEISRNLGGKEIISTSS